MGEWIGLGRALGEGKGKRAWRMEDAGCRKNAGLSRVWWKIRDGGQGRWGIEDVWVKGKGRTPEEARQELRGAGCTPGKRKGVLKRVSAGLADLPDCADALARRGGVGDTAAWMPGRQVCCLPR